MEQVEATRSGSKFNSGKDDARLSINPNEPSSPSLPDSSEKIAILKQE